MSEDLNAPFQKPLVLDLSNQSLQKLPSLPSNLKELIVENNKISSVNVQFPQGIETLSLRNNRLAMSPQMSPTSESLLKLDLSQNRLISLDGISDCLKLQEVYLAYNFLGDDQIQTLLSLTNLKSLDLSFNHLRSNDSISLLLKFLSKLEVLNCSGNDFTQLKVQSSQSLKFLMIDQNKIYNLEFQEELQNLTNLSARENCLKQIQGLEFVPKLTDLYLDCNQIEGIDDTFANLRILISFSITHNRIESSKIKFFKFPILENLNLSYNKLTDLSFLHCSQLRKLLVAHNNLTDISHGLYLDNLTDMDISLNQLESLENIQHSQKLVILNASHNKIASQKATLEKIQQLASLEVIDLKANLFNYKYYPNLEYIQQFYQRNDNLEQLTIEVYDQDNQLENDEVLKHRKRYRGFMIKYFQMLKILDCINISEKEKKFSLSKQFEKMINSMDEESLSISRQQSALEELEKSKDLFTSSFQAVNASQSWISGQFTSDIFGTSLIHLGEKGQASPTRLFFPPPTSLEQQKLYDSYYSSTYEKSRLSISQKNLFTSTPFLGDIQAQNSNLSYKGESNFNSAVFSPFMTSDDSQRLIDIQDQGRHHKNSVITQKGLLRGKNQKINQQIQTERSSSKRSSPKYENPEVELQTEISTNRQALQKGQIQSYLSSNSFKNSDNQEGLESQRAKSQLSNRVSSRLSTREKREQNQNERETIKFIQEQEKQGTPSPKAKTSIQNQFIQEKISTPKSKKKMENETQQVKGLVQKSIQTTPNIQKQYENKQISPMHHSSIPSSRSGQSTKRSQGNKRSNNLILSEEKLQQESSRSKSGMINSKKFTNTKEENEKERKSQYKTEKASAVSQTDINRITIKLQKMYEEKLNHLKEKIRKQFMKERKKREQEETDRRYKSRDSSKSRATSRKNGKEYDFESHYQKIYQKYLAQKYQQPQFQKMAKKLVKEILSRKFGITNKQEIKEMLKSQQKLNKNEDHSSRHESRSKSRSTSRQSKHSKRRQHQLEKISNQTKFTQTTRQQSPQQDQVNEQNNLKQSFHDNHIQNEKSPSLLSSIEQVKQIENLSSFDMFNEILPSFMKEKQLVASVLNLVVTPPRPIFKNEQDVTLLCNLQSQSPEFKAVLEIFNNELELKQIIKTYTYILHGLIEENDNWILLLYAEDPIMLKQIMESPQGFQISNNLLCTDSYSLLMERGYRQLVVCLANIGQCVDIEKYTSQEFLKRQLAHKYAKRSYQAAYFVKEQMYFVFNEKNLLPCYLVNLY